MKRIRYSLTCSLPPLQRVVAIIIALLLSNVNNTLHFQRIAQFLCNILFPLLKKQQSVAIIK